jgi:ABC-type uncharacterized transport system auxiliary subunit
MKRDARTIAGAKALLLIGLALSGCFTNNTPPLELYVLRGVSAPHTTEGEAATTRRLAVGAVLAPRYLETLKILYRTKENRLRSYLYSSWAETPPRQLGTLLLDQLEAEKRFLSVSRTATGSIADLQLNTELREFIHIPDEKRVVAAAVAELVDLRTRSVVAREHFTESVPTENGEDIARVVSAFNGAVGELTKKIAAWVAASTPAQESPPSSSTGGTQSAPNQ